MRLFTKEEMLNFLRQLKMGVENGSYILNPWYGENDPGYPKQNKEAMLLELEWLLKPRNTCLKKTERNRQVQAPAA